RLLVPCAVAILGADQPNQRLQERRGECGCVGERRVHDTGGGLGHDRCLRETQSSSAKDGVAGATPASASTLRSHGGGVPLSMTRVRSSTASTGCASATLIG